MSDYLNFLARLTIFCLVPMAAVAAQSQILETPNRDQHPTECQTGEVVQNFQDWKIVRNRAKVLIGADVLGRIAVVADYDRDGLVDELMQFTATTRLTSPTPVLLERAKVVQTTSSLMVEAADRTLAVAVTVNNPAHETPAIPRNWSRFSQQVVKQDGIALVRYKPLPGVQEQFATYDHNSIQTWPSHFHRDLLYMGTAGPTANCDSPGCIGCQCNDSQAGCTSGGCGTHNCACGSPCGGGTVQSCGTGWYACCRCSFDDTAQVWACTGDCLACGPGEVL